MAIEKTIIRVSVVAAIIVVLVGLPLFTDAGLLEHLARHVNGLLGVSLLPTSLF
ncbi:MAG: hypothetical protein JXQ73_12030 [Phycisphaerae bacterium]|nr:hypothetical protein [Phycisphaerae bacterium]